VTTNRDVKFRVEGSTIIMSPTMAWNCSIINQAIHLVEDCRSRDSWTAVPGELYKMACIDTKREIIRFYRVGVRLRVSEVFGRLVLAYGSDSDSKEHSGKCQKAAEPSPLRKPLPLDIVGSDNERNEDTYTADSALAQEPW